MKCSIVSLVLFAVFISSGFAAAAARPHIVLVMADDQGYGETGYYNHPVLKTPNLDAMAASGLRFDRFYAGAPVCSPTRASVLTGRSNDRTGVESHGYALRLQEKTITEALRGIGYATGHFGKWHLNALRGPGVPVLKDDAHGPGRFGFERWLSVTNFFDIDPVMSREGEFEEFRGDSSEIIVAEALAFIKKQAAASKPSFSVIWYGSPHDPFRASREDREGFAELDPVSQNHYGELVAMDRSIGALRRGLRSIGVARDTLVWFNSDNGGLPKIKPGTVGKLRAFKGSVYEGGLRVPAIAEWPAAIEARITNFPACTMDIFPTIAEIVGLPESAYLEPQDGMSLRPLFAKEIGERAKPIPFSHIGRSAMIDNNYKIVKAKAKGQFELYDLASDPSESHNLISEKPQLAKQMRSGLEAWLASVQGSVGGADYPEGTVDSNHPKPKFWMQEEAYRPYFEAWKERPEYRSRLSKQKKGIGLQELEIEVPLAPVNRKAGEIIVSIEKDGSIVLGGKMKSKAELEKVLSKLVKNNKDQAVILRGHREAMFVHIVEVIDICQKVGIWNVAFATLPVRADD